MSFRTTKHLAEDDVSGLSDNEQLVLRHSNRSLLYLSTKVAERIYLIYPILANSGGKLHFSPDQRSEGPQASPVTLDVDTGVNAQPQDAAVTVDEGFGKGGEKSEALEKDVDENIGTQELLGIESGSKDDNEGPIVALSTRPGDETLTFKFPGHQIDAEGKEVSCAFEMTIHIEIDTTSLDPELITEIRMYTCDPGEFGPWQLGLEKASVFKAISDVLHKHLNFYPSGIESHRWKGPTDQPIYSCLDSAASTVQGMVIFTEGRYFGPFNLSATLRVLPREGLVSTDCDNTEGDISDDKMKSILADIAPNDSWPFKSVAPTSGILARNGGFHRRYWPRYSARNLYD